MARIKYYDTKTGQWKYADKNYGYGSGGNIDEVYILSGGEALTDVPKDVELVIDLDGGPDFDLSDFVQKTELQDEIDKTLAHAKASGEFDGKDYVLTPDDKTEIAEMAAELVEVPESSGGITVTGAKVGQTVKISAVDENGKPTAWEPTDFPSGGGSGVKWVKIADVTTEEDVTEIVVDEGLPNGIIGLFFRIETKYGESTSYNYIAPTINGSGFIPTNLPLRENRNIYNVTCEIHEDETAHGFYGFSNVETPSATIVACSGINLPVTSVGVKHAGIPVGTLATGTVFKAWAKLGG